MTGKPVEAIWESIDDIIGKTGAALKPALQNEKQPCDGCYQIWGADIVFDIYANPYLLEVNTSPSIERNNLLADGSILEMVYPDLWSMKGVDPSKPRVSLQGNDWREIIFSLIDPTTVHKNGILYQLIWLKLNVSENNNEEAI